MKTLRNLTILITLTFFTNHLFAQSEKYKEAMTTAIADFNSAVSKELDMAECTRIANRFERIAMAEPTAWLPRYYAAHLYSTIAYGGNDATHKTKTCDKADALLKEAMALAGENSELMVVDAQINEARMLIDPASGWQTYGPRYEASLARAEALNQDNPRVYVLRGTSLLYTPEQFGGGKKVAKPVLEKALEKFANFKPESALHPSWGEPQAAWMLSQCQQ